MIETKSTCRRAALLSRVEVTEVMLPLEKAAAALRQGVASEWQWRLAASAINTAIAIEKHCAIPGMHEHFRAAELSLGSIRRRAIATRMWKPTQLFYLELDAIGTAVDLHRLQLERLPRGQMLRTLTYAQADVPSSAGQIKFNQPLAGITEMAEA